MGFHEVRFDENISYGSSSGSGYSTSVIETDGGHEEIVSRRENARRKFNISYGVKTMADLANVIKFYLARNGPANGFRFKDWLDYHSSPTNPSYEGATGTADQTLGYGDASNKFFQLKKTYTSGLISKTRNVTKPVSGTTSVWLNGVLQASGWTVDTTTGIIEFTSAPGSGVRVDASFEFDVPVRFGKEVDDLLEARIESFGDGSIPDIPLVEVIDEDPGYVGEFFYGGANEISITSNLTISTGLGRLWSVSSAASLSVSLPDPANIPAGGPIFYVVNAGSNTFTLKDHSGSTLVSVTAGSCVEVLLTVQSGGTKVWYAI